MKRIRITEDQYRTYLSEVENAKPQVTANPNQSPKQQASEMGINDLSKVTITTDPQSSTAQEKSQQGQSSTGVYEGNVISKKQLDEYRLKLLKENSRLYTVRDFIGR